MDKTVEEKQDHGKVSPSPSLMTHSSAFAELKSLYSPQTLDPTQKLLEAIIYIKNYRTTHEELPEFSQLSSNRAICHSDIASIQWDSESNSYIATFTITDSNDNRQPETHQISQNDAEVIFAQREMVEQLLPFTWLSHYLLNALSFFKENPTYAPREEFKSLESLFSTKCYILTPILIQKTEDPKAPSFEVEFISLNAPRQSQKLQINFETAQKLIANYRAAKADKNKTVNREDKLRQAYFRIKNSFYYFRPSLPENSLFYRASFHNLSAIQWDPSDARYTLSFIDNQNFTYKLTSDTHQVDLIIEQSEELEHLDHFEKMRKALDDATHFLDTNRLLLNDALKKGIFSLPPYYDVLSIGPYAAIKRDRNSNFPLFTVTIFLSLQDSNNLQNPLPKTCCKDIEIDIETAYELIALCRAAKVRKEAASILGHKTPDDSKSEVKEKIGKNSTSSIQQPTPKKNDENSNANPLPRHIGSDTIDPPSKIGDIKEEVTELQTNPSNPNDNNSHEFLLSHPKNGKDSRKNSEENPTLGWPLGIFLFFSTVIAASSEFTGICILTNNIGDHKWGLIIDGIDNAHEAGALNISTSNLAAVFMIAPTALFLLSLMGSYLKDLFHSKPFGNTLATFFQPAKEFVADKICCFAAPTHSQQITLISGH